MKNQKTKNWEEELLKNFNDPLDMMKLDIDYQVAYNANKSTTWKGSWYNFEASCMSSWLMMQVFWFLKENQYHDKTPVLTKRRYYNSKLSGDILRNFFCCGFMPVLTLKKKVHLKRVLEFYLKFC